MTVVKMDPEKTVESLANGDAQTILAVMAVALGIVSILLFRHIMQITNARLADADKAIDRSREDMMTAQDALNKNTNALQGLKEAVSALAARGPQ